MVVTGSVTMFSFGSTATGAASMRSVSWSASGLLPMYIWSQFTGSHRWVGLGWPWTLTPKNSMSSLSDQSAWLVMGVIDLMTGFSRSRYVLNMICLPGSR